MYTYNVKFEKTCYLSMFEEVHDKYGHHQP